MLVLIYWGFSCFLFIAGMMMFVFNCKHLLMMLLSLEFMVLGLFLCLFLYLNYFSYESFFIMLFLTFTVCEGALGLAVLVSMIRTHGNDYFNTFSVLQC
uniref:NADH dehydrogenase subunit 4L n=1 Tax=Dicranoptycha shandongensis TaxID=3102771 RepID=UPI002E776547|nr:NADH dehydrogenase subunit 4L [Dicranoptycha shandongensis]WPO01003.1 NADH dehydrogenase subunit 4L [Dicranoptycha shandongensis]